MAFREIVKMGDDVLTKKCRPVEKFDDKLHIILDDMKETLEKENGCGLAAPQIGLLRRICIVDCGDGLIEMINPEIIEQDGEQRECEGCLSAPGKWGITVRPKYVKIKAYDRNGKQFTADGEDLKARAFCHEIDHLDGILFFDKVIEMVED